MKIITVADVADLLKVKPSTVYAWAEQRVIPSIKLNGTLRFDENEILSWINDSKRPERCYNGTIQAGGPKKGGKR